MACENEKFVGRSVTLEYSIGCGDAQPAPRDWKKFGSLRTKEFNLAWDTTDATDSDSIGALRENLATFQNLTISGDGIIRTSGPLGENLKELTKHVANPVATGGQPTVWLRMTFPDLTFTCLMLVSTLARSAPYDDVATYSLEASATASQFGLVIEDTVTAITAVAVTPATPAINTDNGTVQLSAAVTPSNASQSVTWTSSDPLIATVNGAGLVSAVANGSATITATSAADPTKTGTATLTVTNQT